MKASLDRIVQCFTSPPTQYRPSIQAKLGHEGEYLDQVKDFKFGGSYKSADGDCTNEIK